jgi:single-strand DNA-binding protein
MATRSLNKVQLIGNLTRDPELRYTPQGTAVCTFGLATNRSWVPSDGGERREETEFHRIVAWQKLGELCAQLLFKGRKVYVEGRLQTRDWTAADGTQRRTTEIVIDDMIILDSKRQVEERVEVQGMGVPAEETVVEVPEAVAAAEPVVEETTEAGEPAQEPEEKPKGKKVGKVKSKKGAKGKKITTEEENADLDTDAIPF